MKRDGEGDLRVRRTHESIRRAFSEMLLEMPYARITVTELSRRAGINKKTFYRHYPVLDDLLEEVQREFVQPFVERTAGMRYPDDIGAVTREFLSYSAQQGSLYDAVIASGMHESILDKMLDEMGSERSSAQKPPEGWTEKEWSLYLNFVNSSQVRIYQQWVLDGREVPVQRMVSLGVRLVCNGAVLESSWSYKPDLGDS